MVRAEQQSPRSPEIQRLSDGEGDTATAEHPLSRSGFVRVGRPFLIGYFFILQLLTMLIPGGPLVVAALSMINTSVRRNRGRTLFVWSAGAFLTVFPLLFIRFGPAPMLGG